MTAHEVFASLSADEAGEVLGWLEQNDRGGYKAAAGMLASRRNLRPVFVERKPRPERNAWIKDALGKRANADLAAEIMQSWIMGPHGPMVCQFLDALKIPHDGKGLIESLPAEPPAADVGRAVDGLFSSHSRTAVRAYLNLFVSMDMAEWPALESLVATDPRICPNPPNP